MKQVDLEPDQYAEQKRGQWRRKSNPKRSGIMFGFCVAFLIFFWWTWGGVTTFAAGSAMIAFAGGVLAADWLRDFY